MINVNGALNATDNIALATSNNGFINLNANVTAGKSTVLVSGGTGGVAQDSASTLTSPFTVVFAGSGGIDLKHLASTSLVVTTSGAAAVNNVSQVLGLAGNVGSGDFTTSGDLIIAAMDSEAALTAKSGGNISTLGQVMGTDVKLQTTGTNGSITLGDNITGTSSLSLLASGTGNISQKNNGVWVSSPVLTMSTGSGDIGSQPQFMITDAVDLTFVTTGSVYIFNSNSTGSLNVKSWSGTTLALLEDGQINVIGDLTASKNLVFGTFSNGNIALNANVTVGNTAILNASGTGGITQADTKLLSATILSMSSGIAGIGQIHTNSSVITLNTLGDATVNNDRAGVLLASVGKNLSFTNNGTLAIINLEAGDDATVDVQGNIFALGRVTADNVSMTATGGAIGMAGDVTGRESVHLTTTIGSVTQLFRDIVMSAPEVVITSDNGDIGLELNYMHVSSPEITVATDGNIYLDSKTSTKLNVPRSGSLHYTGFGDLTVVSNINSSKAAGNGGAVSFIITGGSFNAPNIFANGGGPGNTGGSVFISANSILVSNITADGTGGANGGAVFLASEGGVISFNSISADGTSQGGAVTLLNSGGVVGGTVKANGANQGGKLAITGNSGVFVGNLLADGGIGGTIAVLGNSINVTNTSASGGVGGGISFAGGNMNLGTITASGSAAGGNISANGSNLNIGTANATSGGAGGAITLNAPGGVVIGSALANGGGGGGTVSINGGGGISASLIDVSDPPFGNGGSVFLTSSGIISVGSIFGTAEFGNGGLLVVNSPMFFASGFINFSSLWGRGGTVIINSPFVSLANPINVRGFILDGQIIGPAVGLQATNRLADFSNVNQFGARCAVDMTPFGLRDGQDSQREEEEDDDNVLLAGVSKDEQGQSDNGAIFEASSFDDTLSADNKRKLAGKGIVVGKATGGNTFDLDKGNVLFSPRKNEIRVKTHECVAYISPGAHVWIMETGNDVAICDLSDSHGGDVKIVANNKTIELAPGHQIVLTRDSRSEFDAVNPAYTIGYRNLRQRDLGAGITAYTSEMSIVSALSNVELLKQMLHSPQASQRHAAKQMLKTAAVVSHMSRTSGAYKLSLSRRGTAADRPGTDKRSLGAGSGAVAQ